MKPLSKLFITLLLITHTAISYAESKSSLIKGTAVTGTNRLLGNPTTDYGPPLGTAGFYNVGVYNPGGSTPLPIDENTPANAILATSIDPGFLMLAGLPISLIDESKLNIPLQNVPANVSPAGDHRMQLPSTLAVDPVTPNQAEPMDAVTLNNWLKASGTAKLKCGDHKNTVYIQLHNLIPNRLYTIWGIFESPDSRFVAVPLGGTPNAVMTNAEGNSKFKRELGFCPFVRTDSGSRLLAIDVVYHSDHQVYAVMPDLPLTGLITGSITHTQLEFTISGQSLID